MILYTRRAALSAVFSTLLTVTAAAQMPMNEAAPAAGKAMPSPPAVATAHLNGKSITINYNSPSLRGRHVGGSEIVPWDKVWRTGANPATTLKTEADLTIGTLQVPAGTYTLYTLPSATKWLLIINKQTGQWGTVYNQEQDLGRTEMKKSTLTTPQEVMSISFESVTSNRAQLHIRWETTDVSVPVSAK